MRTVGKPFCEEPGERRNGLVEKSLFKLLSPGAGISDRPMGKSSWAGAAPRGFEWRGRRHVVTGQPTLTAPKYIFSADLGPKYIFSADLGHFIFKTRETGDYFDKSLKKK